VVDNTGTISLENGAHLEFVQHGATLEGGGMVLLSDSADNLIFGSDAGVTLTNVDNTISGAGQLGDGQLTLINEGTIIATGENALTIESGSAISNTGTLEATGAGGLVVNGELVNDGLLWANGGNLDLEGNVSGTGHLSVDGTARVEIGGSFSENITLGADAHTTLVVDHAAEFTGTIAGLDSDDALQFGDISAQNASFGYTENAAGTGGTLTVTDGTHTASIGLTGDYSADDFHLGGDGSTLELDFSKAGDGSATEQTLSGTGGADTFHIGPDALSGNIHDFITDYSASEGDRVDLSDILKNISSTDVEKDGFVKVSEDAKTGNVTLSVDQNGGGDHFVDVSTLHVTDTSHHLTVIFDDTHTQTVSTPTI